MDPVLNKLQVSEFFRYATERYSIYQKRMNGYPKPWTTDSILQQYRFCNVFREDDKVTMWFRSNVRTPMRANPRVCMATLVFRFVNSIGTGQHLLEAGVFRHYESAKFAAAMKQIKDAGKPMLGAAYMIKTPNGKNKITGLQEIFEPFAAMGDSMAEHIKKRATMKALVDFLTDFPYVGGFMAYEIACDLQYTDWFKPSDTMSWANPGPGARRGLQRLVTETGVRSNTSLSTNQMLSMMQELLTEAYSVRNWPGHWRMWDMRTVEHTLCEFDKYKRAQLGEGKPKQKFEGR